MPLRKTLTATTLAFGLAVTAGAMTALSAQSAAAQSAADYSGDQIEAFTMAYLEVMDLREQYVPQLEAAGSEDEQRALIEEANAEIVEAIEGTEGLTLEDYEAIAQAASEDQELQTRIVTRLEEMQQGGE
mgnify:FL=1